MFRIIIDRQSGKSLYKLTKFKIVRVTDHTYITDNGKVYRKNHICLKPNYRYTVSVAPNTIGARATSSSSTFRGAAKRSITRSQPTLLEQRPNNPSLSTPMVNLTIDSSSESSFGPNNSRQGTRNFTTTGKRQRFQCDSPPVRFARQPASSTSHSFTHATTSKTTDSTQPPDGSFISPQLRTVHRAIPASPTIPAEPMEIITSSPEHMVSSPGKEVSKDLNPASHSTPLELSSSYHSLSQPAQPVADNAEPTRTSHRSKKPTQFFGDPLRHSVRLVEEDQMLSSETTFALPVSEAPILPSVEPPSSSVTEDQVVPSVASPVPTSSPRRRLIRDRFPMQSPPQTSPSLAHRNETKGTGMKPTNSIARHMLTNQKN